MIYIGIYLISVLILFVFFKSISVRSNVYSALIVNITPGLNTAAVVILIIVLMGYGIRYSVERTGFDKIIKNIYK